MDLNRLMAGMGPIQEAMAKQNQERAKQIIGGSAGGGAVTVRLAGDLTVKAVTIAPAAAAASADDVSMLEDLIAVALGDALSQYQRKYGSTPEEQLQKTLAGSNLGALLGPMLGG